MMIKFAYVPLTAVAALGLMVSGCNKKAKVVAAAPPRPSVTEPTRTEPVRPQTATSDSAASRTTTPAPSNGRITDAERNTLNKSLTKLEDVLFDYDKASIRPDATKTLEGDVSVIRDIMQRYPSQKVKIEGHADERGSDEYNIALGDKRAVAAKEFLSNMGVSSNQLEIVSFGKQRPVCGEHTEDCWQKNRRAHFVAEGTN